jgi:hypothetical protein
MTATAVTSRPSNKATIESVLAAYQLQGFIRVRSGSDQSVTPPAGKCLAMQQCHGAKEKSSGELEPRQKDCDQMKLRTVEDIDCQRQEDDKPCNSGMAQ